MCTCYNRGLLFVPYIRGLLLLPDIRGLLLVPDIVGDYCWYLISGG